jgi:hypothetical protein
MHPITVILMNMTMNLLIKKITKEIANTTKMIQSGIPISAIQEIANINSESTNVYSIHAGVGPMPAN